MTARDVLTLVIAVHKSLPGNCAQGVSDPGKEIGKSKGDKTVGKDGDKTKPNKMSNEKDNTAKDGKKNPNDKPKDEIPTKEGPEQPAKGNEASKR